MTYIFRFNGDSFKYEPSSKFSHLLVHALGSYRQKPFVTGSSSPANGLKTEILNYKSGQWYPAQDYPFSYGDMWVKTKKFEYLNVIYVIVCIIKNWYKINIVSILL